MMSTRTNSTIKLPPSELVAGPTTAPVLESRSAMPGETVEAKLADVADSYGTAEFREALIQHMHRAKRAAISEQR